MTADALFEIADHARSSTTEFVEITFGGRVLHVPAGVSVAAALLSSGVGQFRSSPVSGDGRGPYCMMGVCFECLLEIDGVPNRQGCLVEAKDGMRISRQDTLPELPLEDRDAAAIVSDLTGVPHVS